MSEAAIIDQIYDAPLAGDERWLGFLESYRNAVGSHSAQLMIARRDPGSPRASIDQFDPGFATAQAAYYTGFEADNPIRYETLPAGRTISLYDCTSRSSFERSRFYRQFARENRVEFALAIHIAEIAGLGIWLNTSRGGARDYSAAERALTTRLAPHLRRALRLDPVIAAFDGDRASARIVIDAAGRIVHAGARADRVFAACRCVSRRGPRLVFARRADEDTFADRLHDVQRSGAARAMMCAALEGSRLQLLIKPMPAALRGLCTIDLIDDDPPAVSPLLLADVYGLTRAEAQVALMLAHGAGTSTIALARSLSEASVRTYLKRIFEKTGARRQSELVAIILRGAAGRA